MDKFIDLGSNGLPQPGMRFVKPVPRSFELEEQSELKYKSEIDPVYSKYQNRNKYNSVQNYTLLRIILDNVQS